MVFVTTVVQEPKVAVKVKVIVPDSDVAGVYVAVAGLLALVQVPAPPDQSPVAPPGPTLPPMAGEGWPWHIGLVNAGPAEAVGLGLTVIVFVLVTVQDPSVEVRVSVITPDSVALAVYLAVLALLALVHEPVPPLQSAEAPEVTLPPIAADC
jgi:hypothetical protein